MDDIKIKIDLPDSIVIDLDRKLSIEGNTVSVPVKKKDLTFNDIIEWAGDHASNVFLTYARHDYECKAPLSPYVKQYNHLIAYCRLFLTAMYLNDGWVASYDPLKINYCIFRKNNNEYGVNGTNSHNPGSIYFKDEKRARKAIKMLKDDLRYLDGVF